jgi:hypothetical protein
MQPEFKKTAGYCLITGSVLLTLTMILHPSGGPINHILKIKNIIVTSHSLAILSLPFLSFGFYGLTLTLNTKSRISLLAFIINCFGLFATMIAATINGLTLPLYLSNYSSNEANITMINAIRNYGTSINIPMDYIFITSIALSIGIWSILIIKLSAHSKWIGYLGILLIVLLGIFNFNTFSFVNLQGFRVLISGFVSWVIITGISMIIKNENID